MNPIQRAFESFSTKSRAARAAIFRNSFDFDTYTKILDLGSEGGANIAEILSGTVVRPENVFIADIDGDVLRKGNETFGFSPALIKENEALAFGDRYFDIVYCSSVIEHVTIPKARIWDTRSSTEFREKAWNQQSIFASEIERVGRQYFVQTPCRSFPVESHTWLPFAGSLPREILVPVVSVANRIWVKKSIPDFNLLTPGEMQKLFPEARIELERKFGMTKSIMAIKTHKIEKAETEIGEEEIEN